MPKQLKLAQRGFTIIELLIVIAIIGILAGLVLNNFQGAQAKARDTQRRTDINSVHAKLEEYYNENGAYPTEDFTTALFPGIDEGAFEDPNGDDIQQPAPIVATTATADAYVAATNPTGDYTYVSYDCTGTTAGTDTCQKYVIYGWIEKPSGTYSSYTKNSLN